MVTRKSYFWEIPNHPAIFRALEEGSRPPRPAYIYPTLHPGCWKNDKEDSYKAASMLDEQNPGRAICYYLQGYMSALLYGHSMAAMAAYSQKPLPALVIIPYSKLIANNEREVLGCFADVVANMSNIEESSRVKEMVEYKKEPVIRLSTQWDEEYLDSWKCYPMPDQLMNAMEVDYV